MSDALPVVLLGVSKAFGSHPVLSSLDLEADAGSILVLLGESGAGKSTVLRLVAGLDDPDAGRIEVGGVVVADPRSRVPAEARGVGMVFQSLELWPHMTVAENVAFGLPGRPRRREALGSARVAEVAEAVGLPAALLERRPTTLSGGERQRVAIARALAPRPGVLLYDEPLANLDPSRRAEIRRLVRAVRATSSTTVVYVTHDAAEALEVGDRVAVLSEGRVIEHGTPAEVYARPRTLAGAKALGPVSVLPATRRADGRYDTALGSFGSPERATDAESAAPLRLLLRPEQVGPADEGVPATVVDAHPVAGGFAFSARLASDGLLVEGRASRRPPTGSTLRLQVTGEPVLVPATATAAEEALR